jgi:hypothetical protein
MKAVHGIKGIKQAERGSPVDGRMMQQAKRKCGKFLTAVKTCPLLTPFINDGLDSLEPSALHS